MHKKLIMACMAIVALAAFVIAPAASASPVLTSSGFKVPTGTSIEGKNTGNTLFSGGFNVTCTTAVLNGSVTANTGTSIKGEIPAGSASFTGTGSGGDCTSALGDTKSTVNSKLCLETVSGTDNVKVTGCGASITFSLWVTSAGVVCTYSAASVTGTYKTSDVATVNLNAQAASRETTNIFCPASGTLTMDFDLYTTGSGTPMGIS